jgi:hypothetical protein
VARFLQIICDLVVGDVMEGDVADFSALAGNPEMAYSPAFMGVIPARCSARSEDWKVQTTNGGLKMICLN